MSNLGWFLAQGVRRLYDPEFRKAADFLRYVETIPEKQWSDFRNKLLLDQLNNVLNVVPYYKNFSDKLDMSMFDDPVALLQQFPLLYKKVVRKHGNDLRTPFYDKRISSIRRSGGTTGEPIEGAVDQYTQSLETLSFFRGLEWMGWKPGMQLIKFSGGSLGFGKKVSMVTRIRDYLISQSELSAFNINENTVSDYVASINSRGDSVLMGYASTILNLSRQMRKRNLSCPNVKQIFTTAEQLHPIWRHEIKQIFNCPVKSYYGCGEINSLGYQAEEGGSYLIPDEVNYIESIDIEGVHYLAITGLHNCVKPFIRYINGDVGEVGYENYDGKSRLVLRTLNGRVNDMLIDNTGQPISGVIGPHLVYKTGLNVELYQFVQNSIEQIDFLYSREQGQLGHHEKQKVIKVLQDTLGPELSVRFKMTEDFVKSSSQKHRITINNI